MTGRSGGPVGVVFDMARAGSGRVGIEDGFEAGPAAAVRSLALFVNEALADISFEVSLMSVSLAWAGVAVVEDVTVGFAEVRASRFASFLTGTSFIWVSSISPSSASAFAAITFAGTDSPLTLELD